MRKKPIAITTISLNRTPEEGETVLETVKILNSLGIPIIIADGGSPIKQKKIMKSFSNVTFLEAEGLTNEIKTTFRRGAAMADSLFYLHLDKLDFVRKYVPKLIQYYLARKDKKMIVAARTKKSFQTYPPYQRKVEEYLNYVLGDYCGSRSDYYYGPKIFSSMLVPYLKALKGDVGWGIEAYFYVLNHRLSLPMEFYPVEITAPAEVLADELEFKQYRLKGLLQQVEGFLQGQKVEVAGQFPS
ncbi:MAG: hypothetical protein WC650_01390 [Candidatus Doudnabacteria bacterium]